MKKIIAIATVVLTMAITGVVTTSVMGAAGTSSAIYLRGGSGGNCYC